MHEHAKLIEALGDGTAVAEWLSGRTHQPVDREAVYKWKKNGVAWRYRNLVAAMADELKVLLPDGFLQEADGPADANAA